MPVSRFFISSLSSPDIKLEGSEFHHLVHVNRNHAGDEVELVNGLGELAKARVTSLSKKEALLHIMSVDLEPAPKKQIILCQALTRMNRLDWILEKGTELGASSFWLFPGETSERQELNTHQLERLQGITIAALKQSGRLWLPSIKWFPPLVAWPSWPKLSLFGDLSPHSPPLLKILPELPEDRDLYFFIGPESGFTSTEIQLLQKHHAIGVSLNKNILRTDTAAITALALLNNAIS